MTSTQQNEKQPSESPHTTQAFIVGFWGVRYQVKDVQRAITFYTQTLGFNLDMQNLPAFGQVSIGGLKLILSGPGAAGSRPMPDGRQQEPGGWNRVLLQVQDLPARIADLKEVILGVLIRMVIPSYFRSATVFRFGHFNVRLMVAALLGKPDSDHILLQQIERCRKKQYVLHQKSDVLRHRRKPSGRRRPTIRHKWNNGACGDKAEAGTERAENS